MTTPETSTPTAEPEPTRIQFEAGATSVTVTGSIERTEQSGVEYDEGYVVRALGGQTMEVIITSPNHDVLLTIVGADGIPLKRYVDGMAEWRGVLPATQDYFIKPVSVGQETVYTLTVTISALESEASRINLSQVSRRRPWLVLWRRSLPADALSRRRGI